MASQNSRGSVSPHAFSDEEGSVAYAICPRCGASRSAAALGLESPHPGQCAPKGDFEKFSDALDELQRVIHRNAVADFKRIAAFIRKVTGHGGDPTP